MWWVLGRVSDYVIFFESLCDFKMVMLLKLHPIIWSHTLIIQQEKKTTFALLCVSSSKHNDIGDADNLHSPHYNHYYFIHLCWCPFFPSWRCYQTLCWKCLVFSFSNEIVGKRSKSEVFSFIFYIVEIW